MNPRRPPDDLSERRAARPSQGWSRRRLVAYGGAGLGVFLLTIAVGLFGFRNTLLNSYAKGRLERAFAEAGPGYQLRLGKLDYALRANRLNAESVTLSTAGTTIEIGGVSLTGVRWAQVWSGTVRLAEVLAEASLAATNLSLEFPGGDYGLRCARVRASVPRSELIAEGAELKPRVEDTAFFAAQAVRRTRFRVVAPECRVSGLAYADLFEGKSYRARSVHFTGLSFNALVNRDKPARPFVRSPLMVHEALAGMRAPLQIDELSLTNGRLTYCEQMLAGAEPAVLTFGDVNASAAGIANRGDPRAAILITAQGDFMDAGTLKVLMSIPIQPADLSLHYSGSLSAMDLTRLNAFIDLTEHVRIKSGIVEAASFEISVVAGHARGQFQGTYRDLQVAVLDNHTGTEKGLDNRVTSFLANVLKVRTANRAHGSVGIKEGDVNYAREPEDEFLEFVWLALWSGVRDAISH